MCFFWLLGMTGVYARQVEEAGWLGMAGFLLIGGFLAYGGLYHRRSRYRVAAGDRRTDRRGGLPGIESGSSRGADLGALPVLYGLSGVLHYLAACCCFAKLRAGILPRWVGSRCGCLRRE
jgi:hypothetical protein